MNDEQILYATLPKMGRDALLETADKWLCSEKWSIFIEVLVQLAKNEERFAWLYTELEEKYSSVFNEYKKEKAQLQPESQQKQVPVVPVFFGDLEKKEKSQKQLTPTFDV